MTNEEQLPNSILAIVEQNQKIIQKNQRIIEQNNEIALLVVSTLLELIAEIKNPTIKGPAPIELVTKELREYVQIKCGNCTIKERLNKIEGKINGQ